ncbi:RNase H domain-containing protein [Trichonephila clavipes]|nr:RNase H domain-containing protein [Trichonephila clavipes]
MLGQRIVARESPPTCLPEIRSALLDEWYNITEHQFDNWIRSMPRRFRLISRHSIYFQWVSSHIGWGGNEIGDSLAKSVTADTLQGDTGLTFAEFSFGKRIEVNALWRMPSAHPWHGTEGEGNILQTPALAISADRTFGRPDLKSTYSWCTQRIFGGIGHRTEAFLSEVRCSNY